MSLCLLLVLLGHTMVAQSMERLEYALLMNNEFVKTGDYTHTMWSTMQPYGAPRMQQHVVYVWIKELAL